MPASLQDSSSPSSTTTAMTKKETVAKILLVRKLQTMPRKN
jgi:hypothetical protein